MSHTGPKITDPARMLAVRVLAKVAICTEDSSKCWLREGNTDPNATMVMPKNIIPKQAAANAWVLCMGFIGLGLFE